MLLLQLFWWLVWLLLRHMHLCASVVCVCFLCVIWIAWGDVDSVARVYGLNFCVMRLPCVGVVVVIMETYSCFGLVHPHSAFIVAQVDSALLSWRKSSSSACNICVVCSDSCLVGWGRRHLLHCLFFSGHTVFCDVFWSMQHVLRVVFVQRCLLCSKLLILSVQVWLHSLVS